MFKGTMTKWPVQKLTQETTQLLQGIPRCNSGWEKGFDHQLRPAVHVTNIVVVPKTVDCGSAYTCWNKSREIRMTHERIHFVKEDYAVFSSSLL